MRKVFIIPAVLLLHIGTFAQSVYPENEDGAFQDMLTPQYYRSSGGDTIRDEINKFLFFAREVNFRHPLEDSTGGKPDYRNPVYGEFGAGKGPTRSSQHHPAMDIYVGDWETNVALYAAYDGHVNVYRDAPKYRHYLSITRDVVDSAGQVLGKMVTLYAHIDLDLDSADNIVPGGKYVRQGDILSKHLYSGTVGGPHLHFEIRYYRPGDAGVEEFYGLAGGSSSFTEPSAGIWPYGYWDPNTGYGYGNPKNHLTEFSTDIYRESFLQDLEIFPNPVVDELSIKFSKTYPNYCISLYSLTGKLLDKKEIVSSSFCNFSLSGFNPGIYLVQLLDKESGGTRIAKLFKE